jgi:hypothetical protein
LLKPQPKRAKLLSYPQKEDPPPSDRDAPKSSRTTELSLSGGIPRTKDSSPSSPTLCTRTCFYNLSQAGALPETSQKLYLTQKKKNKFNNQIRAFNFFSI